MRRTAPVANAVGLLAGYALDTLLGDPRRWHPVAGFGRAAGAFERRLYRPDRIGGCGVHRAGRRRARAARGRRRRGYPTPAGGPGGAVAAGHVDRAGRSHAAPRGTARAGRCVPVTCPPPGDGSATSAGGTRRRWTSRSSPAPPSSRSPRTPPTPSSPRCSGARSPACPGCSATARRTPWTRWSGTGRRATRASARRPPGSTTSLNLVPSRLTGLLTVAVAPVAHGDRRRPGGCGGVTATPPEPQRRAVRGGVRRRARRPPGRPERLLRALRGAAVPRRRPRPEARHLERAARSPARSGWPPSGWPPRGRGPRPLVGPRRDVGRGPGRRLTAGRGGARMRRGAGGERRAAGRRHDLRRRQERASPPGSAAGCAGRA